MQQEKVMKLYDIISNLKFIGIKNYQELQIESLTCNSKEKVEKGLYFAINGLNHNGHQFAMESVKNGAVCLVVEKYLPLDITQILVEDTRSAMAFISSVFFETYKSPMKIIGITGTNGKTTTTFIIRDILTKLGKKVGLIGTQGIFIGSLMLPPSLTTPDPIKLHETIREMQDNGCEYCVMEISAHAIALNKIDHIMYDAVGITNITKDHLDFFINMDNYVNCKASLFDNKHAKCGVVNTDAKYLKDIVKESNLEILTIGKDGDMKLSSTNQTLNGTRFVINVENQDKLVSTNLIGEYNIYNLLMATGCLIKVGFKMEDILRAIKSTEFMIPGRLNFLKVNANYSVVIDYAHTPDGIKNVLSTVRKLTNGRLITVFGCGGDRDKTKRGEMGEIATGLSDFCVITSDNPRSENPELIINQIIENIDHENYITITDRKRAIEYALGMAKENDIVLLLGKGSETYQEIGGVKFHFSDYEVVDEYFSSLEEGEINA